MESTEIKVPWLERMVGNLGERGSARTIFGEPIERSDVTVIPVGKVRFGAGGGSKREIESNEQESSVGVGGGGGLVVSPVGFIELRSGRAKFRRIFDPAGIFQILFGIGLGTWIALRGLRSLRRS